ncbi:BTAD domain-containing putative transcriptional regulator [Streptomyces chrestomyceticus]|uniref:BTAD domain-containing putative transcriptional regulator n=1 Tax=Streptomyces chrestomyceticus TaxID=68185 RepID=UPI0033F57FCD
MHRAAPGQLTAEPYAELLLAALDRGGRQAEALAVYTDTRRLLEQKLGAGPAARAPRHTLDVLAAAVEAEQCR